MADAGSQTDDDNGRPNGETAGRQRNWRENFKRDVFGDPKIGLVAGWVILGLIALISWLAYLYAPNAVKPDACTIVDGQCAGPSDARIPVHWGFITIGGVSFLAFLMGWEPIVRREWPKARILFAVVVLVGTGALTGWGVWGVVRNWFTQLNAPNWLNGPWFWSILAVFAALAAPVLLIWAYSRLSRTVGRLAQAYSNAPSWAQGLMGAPLLWPSWLLSVVDWFFVRVIGWLAGTTITNIWLRYAVLIFWLSAAFALAFPDWPLGPIGVVLGCMVIFAVVRRWLWVEEDRVQFIVRRGKQLKDVQRIGFGQDLRDEALSVMVALFIFIPLGLRQAHLQLDWFEFNDPGVPSLLHWIGFFGAELAKAVPLVDWSEVFGVINGSPLEPKEGVPEGAVAVFILRATLDVLLIASVLQAFQIASQLSEQSRAFRSGALDILDPFEERRIFDRYGKQSPFYVFAPSTDAPHVQDLNPKPGDRNKTRYSHERLVAISAASDAAQDAIIRDRDGLRFALTALAARDIGDIIAQLDADPNADAVKQACLAALVAERLDHAGAAEALAQWAERTTPPDRGNIGLRAIALPAARALLAAAQQGNGAADSINQWIKRLPPKADPEAVTTLAYAAKLASSARPATDIMGAFIEALQPLARAAIEHAWPENPGAFALVREGTPFAVGKNTQHRGKFGHNFVLGRFAVTFDEYDVYCHAKGLPLVNDQGWGRGRRPVINVSWNDAQGYIAWLNESQNLIDKPDAYRLPSEIEWEYCCRAQIDPDAKATSYSFGDDENKLDEYAWFRGNSGSQTRPVGQKKPNAFGLYDMHGNVYEWCADRWHESYSGAPLDGSAWETGERTGRVIRGGSWNYDPGILRSAFRGRSFPDYRLSVQGFRLARTL